MQPFAQKAAQPQTAAPNQQLEALKLSVEAMTALSRLHLHFYESALKNSPLGLMMQGQTMMGQMMLAAFTGQQIGNGKKSEPEKS